jgi:hypothetical protein
VPVVVGVDVAMSRQTSFNHDFVGRFEVEEVEVQVEYDEINGGGGGADHLDEKGSGVSDIDDGGGYHSFAKREERQRERERALVARQQARQFAAAEKQRQRDAAKAKKDEERALRRSPSRSVSRSASRNVSRNSSPRNGDSNEKYGQMEMKAEDEDADFFGVTGSDSVGTGTLNLRGPKH